MNIKSRISASGALLARLKILLLENRGHVYLPGIDNMLTQLTVIETDEVQRIEPELLLKECLEALGRWGIS